MTIPENGVDSINWSDIRQVQREITRWATEQFPDSRTPHHVVYKLVVQEIPEMLQHVKEGPENAAQEVADCFILLMDLASMWNVDLAAAIYSKMNVNYRRTWVQDEHGIMQHKLEEIPSEKLYQYGCPYCHADHTKSRAIDPFEVRGHPHCNRRCLSCAKYFDDEIPF